MRTIPLCLVLLFASCGTTSKCAEPAHRNDLICAAKDAIVDCTKADVKILVDEFAPIVLALVEKATGANGTIDWGSVAPALENFGVQDGGCVLAAVEQRLSGKSSADAGPGRPAHASLVLGVDEFRAKHWPGVKFHLEAGDL